MGKFMLFVQEGHAIYSGGGGLRSEEFDYQQSNITLLKAQLKVSAHCKYFFPVWRVGYQILGIKAGGEYISEDFFSRKYQK